MKFISPFMQALCRSDGYDFKVLMAQMKQLNLARKTNATPPKFTTTYNKEMIIQNKFHIGQYVYGIFNNRLEKRKISGLDWESKTGSIRYTVRLLGADDQFEPYLSFRDRNSCGRPEHQIFATAEEVFEHLKKNQVDYVEKKA